MLTNSFMKFLTVSAGLYCIHHDILCCHKWKFSHKMRFDHLWIYYKTIYNIKIKVKNTIDCKESFRYRKTFVCRIIQCPFKPLCGCHKRRIHCIRHYIIRQRSNSFTSHWISLVCHSGRTNLMLLKWLFDFF